MKNVLLHSCCAPCSGAIIEWMLNNDIRPTIFFSNSNISPKEEYEHRKNECARFAQKNGIEMVEDEYDHSTWLKDVAEGFEDAPERGSRCLRCFKFRLERAAGYASEHGFDTLTTSLASSRWKSLEQVSEAGSEACGKVCGVEWWDRNWRKGGLQERRNQIIKEENFYNQLFCGCEFSKKNLGIK